MRERVIRTTVGDKKREFLLGLNRSVFRLLVGWSVDERIRKDKLGTVQRGIAEDYKVPLVFCLCLEDSRDIASRAELRLLYLK